MRFKLSPVGFTDVPTKKICPLGPRRSPRLVEIGLKARRRKTWAQLRTAAGLPRLHYVGYKMPERAPWPFQERSPSRIAGAAFLWMCRTFMLPL